MALKLPSTSLMAMRRKEVRQAFAQQRETVLARADFQEAQGKLPRGRLSPRLAMSFILVGSAVAWTAVAAALNRLFS